MKQMISVSLAALITLASCKKDETTAPIAPTVVTATGDINARLNEFRSLIGGSLNTTPGLTSGRRELNWDAVPLQFTSQSIPKTFFNPTDANATPIQQRGFTYESDGEFRISNSGFGNIESSLAAQIQPFSGDKVFANISEVQWDTQFRVAGTAQEANINAFGAIFLDVDIANNSFIEFFSGSQSLGKFFAPVHDASTPFSFVGVHFKDAIVTRVRISHGNANINSAEKDITDGGAHDIVAMDDFIYSEPKARN